MASGADLAIIELDRNALVQDRVIVAARDAVAVGTVVTLAGYGRDSCAG